MGIPALAHDVELRIFALNVAAPSGHCMEVGIGIGVHAYAVDAALLDPPYGVLDQVALEVGIALVEVGHLFDKPSVGGALAVVVGGVGVEECGEPVVGDLHRVGEVKPIVGGRIFRATDVRIHSD